ncbi:MAG TPA: hypothetical protein RMI29_06795, partial [Polyangiaceae bacterium LLY-WYZ-15_(1-7)]|nr:hypothetical protein [Polyangiaceae bacterium LLY-WYZ-15_(1-7)]
SIAGTIDYLVGLKENILMGRLIPAGTGLGAYEEPRLSSVVDEAMEAGGGEAAALAAASE